MSVILIEVPEPEPDSVVVVQIGLRVEVHADGTVAAEVTSAEPA